MKITIIALGSRGDVQPFTALGRELKKSGFDVTLATHRVFREFIEQYGLNFSPVIPDNPHELLLNKNGRMFASGNRLRSFIGSYHFFKSFTSSMEIMLDGCLAACKGSGAIVSSIVSPGYQVAELLDIPCFLTGLWPASPTRCYPHPLMPFADNFLTRKLTHQLADFLTLAVFKNSTDRWRIKNGLPELKLSKGIYNYVNKRNYPWLFAFSPAVLPPPADWDLRRHVTGYWFLDEPPGWIPPRELVNFIETGSPPIYIGFGSMMFEDIDKCLAVIINALGISGQRAVFCGGWNNSENIKLTESIFKIDYIPHSWLLPRMAAAIHHGGAGTTAACMRAGIPSLIIPFLADQFFWSGRLYKMRINPEPLKWKYFTAETLADRIDKLVTGKTTAENAKNISKIINAENGAKKAAEIIKNFLN